jgi:hypothetical protein
MEKAYKVPCHEIIVEIFRLINDWKNYCISSSPDERSVCRIIEDSLGYHDFSVGLHIDMLVKQGRLIRIPKGYALILSIPPNR